MLRLATAVVLLVIGWCIWERRLSWGAIPADQVATFSVFNAALALVLFRSHGVAALMAGLGVPYLHCVIAALLLMASGGGQIYAAACRLVPDDQVRVFMHRVDLPAAIAAQVMLLLFYASPAPQQHRAGTDLLSVPCDMWLQLYWIIYCGSIVYMAVFLGWLLLFLRRDPRVGVAPDLMLVACVLGGLAFLDRVGSVLTGGWIDQSGNIMRYSASVGISLAAVATAQSWRQRVEPFRHRCPGSATDECPHGVEPRSR